VAGRFVIAMGDHLYGNAKSQYDEMKAAGFDVRWDEQTCGSHCCGPFAEYTSGAWAWMQKNPRCSDGEDKGVGGARGGGSGGAGGAGGGAGASGGSGGNGGSSADGGAPPDAGGSHVGSDGGSAQQSPGAADGGNVSGGCS